jgi:4'-phosphopantetheinyl transferase
MSTIHHAVGDSHHNEAKRQRLKAETRAEARRILSLLEDRPLEESDIAREAQGRPFFPDREDVGFNIAHSGALAAVSYIRGKNLRTGCDIEQIRPRARAREIADEFFSVPERDYVSQGGFDEARFYEIWTLKECFLKLRGLSVFDMAACPSFINAQGADAPCAFAFDAAAPLSFYLYELGSADERYMLAAALEGPEQQPPEIRWFSQASLACKMLKNIS